MCYGVGNFSELADNRLYGCNLVVGFIKMKNLRNSEYKICLNEESYITSTRLLFILFFSKPCHYVGSS